MPIHLSTVFGSYNWKTRYIIKSFKVFICDVFDKQPFNIKGSFELERLPPIGKVLIVLSWYKLSNTNKLPAFHDTKEQINWRRWLLSLRMFPNRVNFFIIDVNTGPYPVFDSLMYVIIIIRSNYKATSILNFIKIEVFKLG